MDKSLPQRKSPRHPTYDYSKAGAYFVTICTHRHAHIFGNIQHEHMNLTPYGRIASTHVQEIPTHFPVVTLDEFVVMPNHIHLILFLDPDQNNRPTLGTVVGNYKAAVSRAINRISPEPGIPIWQSRYHDVIIHNDAVLQRLREYTINNVSNWGDDKFYR